LQRRASNSKREPKSLGTKTTNRRQIDSLSQILVQIDKELGQTGKEEIPEISAVAVTENHLFIILNCKEILIQTVM